MMLKNATKRAPEEGGLVVFMYLLGPFEEDMLAIISNTIASCDV
jgi:hypothetical protein